MMQHYIINMLQQLSQSMSTEQIYKESGDRAQSLGREYSTERIQRAKFKVKRKMGQLENKVCFFQGQLNPITIQNKSLKQKLVQLSRIVSSSCDMLRNLIPVENNPTKKLKIQMANLEEVSTMIKQDWIDMKQLIRDLLEQSKLKEKTILTLQQQSMQTVSRYEKFLSDIKSKYESQIAELQLTNIELKKKMIEAQQKSAAEREELIRSYSQRLEQSQRIKKEFKAYVSEMNNKCLNYERVAQRLRDEIANNQLEFEKSKQNIKQLYEALMQQKLLQQSKQFDFILKIKQDQKLKIVQQMTAISEELKKKLTQKNFEINHLSGINDKLKEQVGNVKDQIWKHKLEIDRYNKQLKQLEQRLYYQSQTTKQLRNKIENSEKSISQMQEKWRKDKEGLQAQLGHQKLQTNQLRIKVQQVEQMCKKLNEQAEGRNLQFKRKLRQSCEKYQQMLEQEKIKYEQITKTFEEQQKQLKLKISECEKKIIDKQSELFNVKKSNQNEKKRLLDLHESKIKKLQMDFAEKQKKQILDFDEKIKSIQRQMNKQLSELEITNNEFVRKLMADQNLKIHQYQTKFRQLEENAQQSIKKLQKSLSEAYEDNKKLQQKFEEIKKVLEKQTEQHKKSIEEYQKKMEQQRRESELKLKMEKQKLMNQMQQQILLFKKTMDEREADYNNQLSHIQERLQKEINMLKQSNAIDEIEEKYNLLMARLKQEMTQQLKRANLDKERELEKLAAEHNRQLGMLSKKLEFDISKLNEELLQEKEVHAFDKLTRQEKINYLVNKINDYRKQLGDKDTDILQLQFQIQKKNKQLQKIDQIVAERVKGIKKQFEFSLQQAKQQFTIQTKNIKSECQAIVKKVETQRIQFTQSIYNEFQAIKEKYGKQMHRLKSKYDQLERIFEERPSRAEDLSKIKELIQQKSKMDMEIKQCKKKVKQANEIVRYLSLELENYKQTYDIFGPGGEPLSPERRIMTESDSPLRSVIRKQSMSINSQQNEIKRSLIREKQRRYNTESPQIADIRLFPPLGRNTSEAVAEEQNQSEASYQNQKSKKRQAEKIIFSTNLKDSADDKSEELRSNAAIFLGLMNRQSRPPVEYKSGNSGYVRRLPRRRTINVSTEKKIQIKDRTFMFDQ